MMGNAGFTPINLAFIGILDDFYSLYCDIKNVYEVQRKVYIRENGKGYPLLSRTWDDISNKEVRKLIEPFLQKYLYLYSNGYDSVFANAYAFKDFSFIDSDKRTIRLTDDSPFILSFKSFSDFLIEFQIVVTVLDYRKNFITNPEHTIQKSWDRINTNISSLVDKGRNECHGKKVNSIPYTNDTLYIFDKLSSTSCYKQDHPIITARYVAVVAKTGKKISLPVHFCDYCKKYFIGAKTLREFEKFFGKLIIDKKDISEMQTKFGCFSAESKLHSLGYNVISGNMDETERENLLIYLLENKMISYLELCSTIEQNISIFKNSYKHRFAVEKWRTDLKAIGIYILKNPDKTN